MLFFVLAMVFFSGLTGLIYQVTWQKYLSILLGSHAIASAIILSLFFLFMSLGYFFFGRFSHRFGRNRLYQYGGLEFIIGLYAIYSPTLFEILFADFVGGSGTADIVNALGISAVFIGLPTFLMGGTIPVLTQGLSFSFEGSSKVHGQIYTTNTIGAFFGVVVGGFYLIEALGLAATLTVTGDINLLIGVVCFFVARKGQFDGPQTSMSISGVDLSKYWPLYLVSFLSGFYVFTFEKLVIRLAGLSLGSSVYSYSIVVAAFVFAIGVGSYLLTRFEKYIGYKTLFTILSLTSGSAILLYLSVPEWPLWMLRIRFLFQLSHINFVPFWISVLIAYILILVVPVALMGTNLPLLFGLVKSKEEDLAQSVGRLYAVNCLGATLGAVLGGYLAFLWLDAAQVFKLVLVLLVLVSGLSALYILKAIRSRLFSLVIVSLALIIIYLLPSWPLERFTPGWYLYAHAKPELTSVYEYASSRPKADIIFSQFDPNTYVSVTRDQDKKNLSLYVNGKPDAVTAGDSRTRALATLVPISLAKNPVEDIFIVGLGAGLSTGVAASFKEVKKIEVAEISAGVINTLPLFEEFNFDLKNNLHKTEFHIGDAYRVLMTRNQKYDLIACEPSNLWVVGIEKLYSQEFYQLVKTRLNDDGQFVQWFPLFNIDVKTFENILNTFRSVFPEVAIWSAGGPTLTMIGRKTPFIFDFKKTEERFLENQEIYKTFKLNHWQSALTMQTFTSQQVDLIVDGKEDINSVYNPMLEYRAGRAYFANTNTNQEEVLFKNIPLPFAYNSGSEDSLLIEDKKVLVPEVYRDLRAANLDRLASLRLLLKLHQRFPDARELQDEFKSLNEHLYLLGRGVAPKVTKEEFGAALGNLQIKFRQLSVVGQKPRLNYLVKFLEDSCGSESVCWQSKLGTVAALGNGEQQKEMAQFQGLLSFTDEQKAKIKSNFEALINNYKAIGAY